MDDDLEHQYGDRFARSQHLAPEERILDQEMPSSHDRHPGAASSPQLLNPMQYPNPQYFPYHWPAVMWSPPANIHINISNINNQNTGDDGGMCISLQLLSFMMLAKRPPDSSSAISSSTERRSIECGSQDSTGKYYILDSIQQENQSSSSIRRWP